eukprot:m.161163 g.161163  ORF g.161163 m.161163 type:complete len:737 (-) comp18049_c0_seq1:147-2357(-)
MAENNSGMVMPQLSALRSVPLKMPKLSQDLLTSSELDSENAHFDMTEALMSAIEEASNSDLQVCFAPAWANAAAAKNEQKIEEISQVCGSATESASQHISSATVLMPTAEVFSTDKQPLTLLHSARITGTENCNSSSKSHLDLFDDKDIYETTSFSHPSVVPATHSEMAPVLTTSTHVSASDIGASRRPDSNRAPGDIAESSDSDNEYDSDSSGSEGLDALIAHRNQLHSTVAALSRSQGSESAESTASNFSDTPLSEADIRRRHFRYHQLHPSSACSLCRHVRAAPSALSLSPLTTSALQRNRLPTSPRQPSSPQHVRHAVGGDSHAGIPRARSASRVAALHDTVRSDRSSSVDSHSHQSETSDAEWTRGWNAVLVTRPVSLDPHLGLQGASTRSKVEETARGFLQSLPAAADSVPPALQPMVDDDDASVPQGLLPTPDVSFDDTNTSLHDESWVDFSHRYQSAPASAETTLRGSEDWAPPRQQIIFHPHVRVSKSEALSRQNHRCAGCGLAVDRSYVSSFKYCEYIGRYFCSSCHSKSLHPIPARILWKWDFRSYPISKFARDLLRRIWGDPLFNVADVNRSLYARVRVLHNARELRQQLELVRTYLASCTAESVTLREINVTIPEDVDVYSMRQLVGVRDATFLTYLHDLIKEGVKHVRTCVLCTAKGFICELCNANEIIFPFETGVTTQCAKCQACFHAKCWARRGHCPKCRRIAKYRRAREAQPPAPVTDA